MDRNGQYECKTQNCQTKNLPFPHSTHLFWSSQDLRGHHSMPVLCLSTSLPRTAWGHPSSAVLSCDARPGFVRGATLAQLRSAGQM